MIKIIKTLYWFILIGLIWQVLEIACYGEIQPRIVDDVIVLITLPFIYKAMN